MENQDKTGINQAQRDESGRFLPGISGNPAGKPKGIKHMSTLLGEAIRKVAEDEAEPQDVLIVKALLSKAKSGDISAIREVWDRLEGKPQQSTDITSDGEKIQTGVVILPSKNENTLETTTETRESTS